MKLCPAPSLSGSLARGVVTIASVAVLFAGAACSGSVSIGGSKGISGPNLEKDLSDRITQLSDAGPESVDCPEGLDAEIGATTTCEMVHDGVRATLAIEAKSLTEDDKTLNFSWLVEPGSQRLLTSHVGETIADAFDANTGLTLTDVTCPEPELAGTAGTVMTCEATTANGRTGPIILNVKGAEGMRVDFGWRLGD